MKFSEFYKLNASQGELDFVDVDPSKDTRLFVDPYAIQINALDDDDPFYDCLLSYFSTLLDSLRSGNTQQAKILVSHLSEPRDTFLGLSKGTPQGHGVGNKQSMAMLDAIRNSEAFKTGLLEDITETALFVDGVGPDKISDLTTNVLRKPLMEYTKSICDMYGIETRNVAMPPKWDEDAELWQSGYAHMPIVDGSPVLLVPKHIVRRRLCLDSQEYYNYYLDYLQAELEPTESLASALRGKSGKVTKDRLKDRYPFDKASLARFAREHPRQFSNFKEIMKTTNAMKDDFIDVDFVYSEATSRLISQLKNLPTGTEHAGEYEKIALRAMTLLFWPHLTFPKAQRPIHGGRKRLDIEFWNYAKSGFWEEMRRDEQINSCTVPIECKNYSHDISNEEFDQINGRFGNKRGLVGILLYRSATNKKRVQERAVSFANDRGHFILTMNDAELIALLAAPVTDRDHVCDNFLRNKFRDLIGFN